LQLHGSIAVEMNSPFISVKASEINRVYSLADMWFRLIKVTLLAASASRKLHNFRPMIIPIAMKQQFRMYKTGICWKFDKDNVNENH